MGVKSKRTIQEQNGDDPDTEDSYIKEENIQKTRDRLAESSKDIVAIQTSFYKGELPRAAAGATLVAMGFSIEDAEKLLPEVEGISRVAKQESPDVNGNGGAGVPGGDAGGNADLGSDDSTDDPLSEIAPSFAGTLTEQTLFDITLLEAGFTGTVTAKNGAVFYYEDGKRIKNPNKQEGGPRDRRHHTEQTAKALQARALQVFEWAVNNPEKLNSEQWQEFPKVLAVIPKDKLKELANRLAINLPGGLRKQEFVDKLAERFPVPANLLAQQPVQQPVTIDNSDQVQRVSDFITNRVASGEIRNFNQLEQFASAINNFNSNSAIRDTVAQNLGFRSWMNLKNETSTSQGFDLFARDWGYLPPVMQQTPYGPQAMVSRGGMVIRDATTPQPSSTSFSENPKTVFDKPKKPANVEVQGLNEATRKSLNSFFGKEVDENVLAAAGNGGDNTRVNVSIRGNTVEISSRGNGYKAYRTIGRDENGNLYCKNDLFMMEYDKNNNPPPDWLRKNPDANGTELLSNQVRALRELGVKKIKTNAARNNDSNPNHAMNGYYTWPRLGYDRSLRDYEISGMPDVVKKSIKDNVSGSSKPNSILNVMATKEGRDWWKEKGDSGSMEFDLSDNSLSMKTLDAYLKEREGKKNE